MWNIILYWNVCCIVAYCVTSRLPIHTGSETDTHARCIPGRVAGRIDLQLYIKAWETHCT